MIKFLAIAQLLLATYVGLAEAAECSNSKPFHIDTRQNPAVVTFDNGCVIRIFNGVGDSSPQFKTEGPCQDWSWINRYCLKR